MNPNSNTTKQTLDFDRIVVVLMLLMVLNCTPTVQIGASKVKGAFENVNHEIVNRNRQNKESEIKNSVI